MSTTILIVALMIGAVLLGYNYFFQPFYSPDNSPTSSLENSPSSIAESEVAVDGVQQWKDLLSNQEKIDQLLALPFVVETESTQSAQPIWDSSVSPGFIVIFGNKLDIISTSKSLSKLRFGQDPQKPKLAFAVDHEGGRVQRFSGNGFSKVPSWRDLCELDTELSRPIMRQSAKEIASLGIDLVLSPLLDVASQSAVLGDRVCSGDPERVATMSKIFIEEFSREGVWSVVKHYPGIGGVTKDLHHFFVTVTIDQKDVLPFHSVLSHNPLQPVMTSFVGVSGLMSQEPCALNPECVSQLSNSYQKSLLITDSLTMESASYDVENETYSRTVAERAVRAIEAGNHVLLFGSELTDEQLAEVRDAILTLYQLELSPNLFKEQVDEAVQRVLEFKYYQLNQGEKS